MRPEFVAAGQIGIYVKRIVMNMMQDVTFPYVAHPDSNVIPVIIVEQDNPPRQYTIRADRILAIHRCLGAAGADVRLFKRTAKVAAGFEADKEQATAEDTRTVAELCRQWRILKTKLSYDIASLPARHPDADLDNLCSAALEAMESIEVELAQRKLLTAGEMYEVMCVVVANLGDEASTIVEEHDLRLLRAVRLGLAWMQGPPNQPA
jgi:hypothetical protein